MEIAEILAGDWDAAEWEQENLDDSEGENDEETHTPAETAQAYIEKLSSESGLHLLQEGRVRQAYTESAERGLFGVFVTEQLKDKWRAWTNAVLAARGAPPVTMSELDAYLGLEMAMSLCPMTDIKEFWSTKLFLGQRDISETMSRSRFQSIRVSLVVHPPELLEVERPRQDPLWHSRNLLQHFQQKFASVAVPYGVSSLDENSVRTKARTRAKSFIPSKPDKFAIRFYAVVGWRSLYVHSIWDNGSGNDLRSSPSQRYTNVFPTLRTALDHTLGRPDVRIEKASAAALWVAMMGHQTRLFESPSGRRLVVCDNFYTRHILAKAVQTFTDGEVRMLGTCRLQLIDKWNKQAVADAVARIQMGERGSWELVAAVDTEPDADRLRAAHHRRQAKLPEHQRTEYAARAEISPNAGFIVFLDRKPVIFYTNDLAATPTARVLDGQSDEAIRCCHGLYPLKRWTEDRMMHRKTFLVPTVVAAYNLAMNAVDRVDQLRSTNPTRRKELRLSMSLLTWALDLSTINAFAIRKEIKGSSDNDISLREFKRRIVESLTSPERQVKEQRDRRAKRKERETLAEVVGVDPSLHVLTPNSTQQSAGKLICYLCSIRGIKRKFRYGCSQCLRGFHVECFAVCHYRHAFNSDDPSVIHAIEAVCNVATGSATVSTRRRLNNSITPIDQLTLPSQ